MKPPARIAVYCNHRTIDSTSTRWGSLILRETVCGKTWANRDGTRYVCECCGKPVPAAW